MNTTQLLDDIQETNDRIIRSGVRDIFTPHTPITKIDALKGRDKELRSLFEHLTTPGQHALLYGERGVGKSSLAETSAREISARYGLKLIKKQCSKHDNFSTIFERPLEMVGINIYSISESNSTGVQIPITSLNFSSSKEIEERGKCEISLNPSFVADKISDIEGLFIIDEFDSIQEDDDKYKIAEVIKLLSDKNSNLKILIVGIAESSKELTMGHPSLTRCLREIRIGRMRIVHLIDILKNGASRLNIEFAPFVMPKIAIVSSGYPYFTHLLALKAVEEVIADERKKVTIDDLLTATERAIENSEESIASVYREATNFSNREMYERILLAAAACREEHFTTSDIVKKYYDIFKEPITTKQISPYLKNLVNEDTSKIIRRLYKGAYRFSDPRMPSFVKIQKAYLPDKEDA